MRFILSSKSAKDNDEFPDEYHKLDEGFIYGFIVDYKLKINNIGHKLFCIGHCHSKHELNRKFENIKKEWKTKNVNIILPKIKSGDYYVNNNDDLIFVIKGNNMDMLNIKNTLCPKCIDERYFIKIGISSNNYSLIKSSKIEDIKKKSKAGFKVNRKIIKDKDDNYIGYDLCNLTFN